MIKMVPKRWSSFPVTVDLRVDDLDTPLVGMLEQRVKPLGMLLKDRSQHRIFTLAAGRDSKRAHANKGQNGAADCVHE